ncbi:hypothetical protein PPERSA_11910 [Pseudocohnilembus persalinus]|uniref:Uncharacterized protein n=1 Tax=Pseudocohnilembus persalinus TaxID=266149 RepID=A0A0V0QKC4_PSEPJ|nr:hypothetical protein PPERSA_11910 [Pseudocohnilembus persalinus]|eukprot:KRX02570.1 hypothetical protein PPERSA_11910 [Pseudocohnilembus persalinus]
MNNINKKLMMFHVENEQNKKNEPNHNKSPQNNNNNFRLPYINIPNQKHNKSLQKIQKGNIQRDFRSYSQNAQYQNIKQFSGENEKINRLKQIQNQDNNQSDFDIQVQKYQIIIPKNQGFENNINQQNIEGFNKGTILKQKYLFNRQNEKSFNKNKHIKLDKNVQMENILDTIMKPDNKYFMKHNYTFLQNNNQKKKYNLNQSLPQNYLQNQLNININNQINSQKIRQSIHKNQNDECTKDVYNNNKKNQQRNRQFYSFDIKQKSQAKQNSIQNNNFNLNNKILHSSQNENKLSFTQNTEYDRQINRQDQDIITQKLQRSFEDTLKNDQNQNNQRKQSKIVINKTLNAQQTNINKNKGIKEIQKDQQQFQLQQFCQNPQKSQNNIFDSNMQDKKQKAIDKHSIIPIKMQKLLQGNQNDNKVEQNKQIFSQNKDQNQFYQVLTQDNTYMSQMSKDYLNQQNQLRDKVLNFSQNNQWENYVHEGILQKIQKKKIENQENLDQYISNELEKLNQLYIQRGSVNLQNFNLQPIQQQQKWKKMKKNKKQNILNISQNYSYNFSNDIKSQKSINSKNINKITAKLDEELYGYFPNQQDEQNKDLFSSSVFIKNYKKNNSQEKKEFIKDNQIEIKTQNYEQEQLQLKQTDILENNQSEEFSNLNQSIDYKQWGFIVDEEFSESEKKQNKNESYNQNMSQIKSKISNNSIISVKSAKFGGEQYGKKRLSSANYTYRNDQELEEQNKFFQGQVYRQQVQVPQEKFLETLMLITKKIDTLDNFENGIYITILQNLKYSGLIPNFSNDDELNNIYSEKGILCTDIKQIFEKGVLDYNDIIELIINQF